MPSEMTRQQITERIAAEFAIVAKAAEGGDASLDSIGWTALLFMYIGWRDRQWADDLLDRAGMTGNEVYKLADKMMERLNGLGL